MAVPWGLTEEEAALAASGLSWDGMLLEGELEHSIIRKWADATGAGDVQILLDVLSTWRRVAGTPTQEGVEALAAVAPEGWLGPQEAHLRAIAAGDEEVTGDTQLALGAVHELLFPQLQAAYSSRFHPEAVAAEVIPPQLPSEAPTYDGSRPPRQPGELPWGLTEDEGVAMRTGQGLSWDDLYKGRGLMTDVVRKWAAATGNETARTASELIALTTAAQSSMRNEDVAVLVDAAPPGWLGANEGELRDYALTQHPDGRIGADAIQWLGAVNAFVGAELQRAWNDELWPAAAAAGLGSPV